MIFDDWLNDIPYQFQNKRNIEVLIRAFSKQLEEIKEVYKQLDSITDISTASGTTLDYVGSIVGLSRKDASMLASRIGMNHESMTDEIYRKFLMYIKLINNTDNTYYDIINGIKILWDDSSSKIYYKEKADRPATIFFSTPRIDLDEIDNTLLKSLQIKPAGINMVYENSYKSLFNLQSNEKMIHDKLTVKDYQSVHESIDSTVHIIMYSNISNGQVHGEVTIRQNEWFLNGEYLLNGEKVLNSMLRKEEL